MRSETTHRILNKSAIRQIIESGCEKINQQFEDGLLFIKIYTDDVFNNKDKYFITVYDNSIVSTFYADDDVLSRTILEINVYP